MVQPTPLPTAVPFGLDFRPRRVRPARQTAPLPLALLALTTLAINGYWDSRRRVPLTAALLLTLVLLAQLSHARPVSLADLRFSLPPLTLPSFSIPSPLARPARAPVAVAPALPQEPAAAIAPAAAQPVLVPSPATRAPWQPPNAAILPYPDHIEAWRPLVRDLIAEAHAEGRLDGPAAKLDDDLVLAVIRQESQGNPDAMSWAGAIGLMQVMPFTFADMMAGDRSLTCAIDRAAMWDVRSNVRAGLRYLSLALNTHEGNLYWALASYNAGIDAVHDWRAAGLYAVPPAGGYWETADYAQVILRDYLRRRPDVAPLIHLPDPMPVEHVPGALRQLRDLDTQRGGARPPEYIPRCPK
ncbi:MAG TPA: lytic transglycosylase domain-containing protein [Chloroflexota bacterium]|nr:lytic transglycosylase domain-containing protein [Chloroflexota bacterium]